MNDIKKSVVIIVLSVVLFLSAAAANFESMMFGNRATVLGFILSILFMSGLVVFPLILKSNKGFIKLSLVFMVAVAVSSVMGLLLFNDIIDAKFLIPVIAGPMTSFYGLRYVISLKQLYLVIIIFALLVTTVLVFLSRKKDVIVKS